MWKHKSSTTIFEHPRLTLIEDEVVLPSGQETKYLMFGEQKNVVTIIAKDANKIAVISEYTYPVNTNIYQFVEGFVEQDESWEAAARRELHEEAGIRAGRVEKIGEFLLNHRRSNATHSVVLATELNEIEQKLESTEQISVNWIDEQEFQEMIASGQVVQKNTLAAWAVYCATQQSRI